MKKTIGKEAKFLARLEKGAVLTRRQAMAQYRLGNPSATVHRLSTEKFANIKRQYTTRKINGVYITTVKYSIA